MKRIIRNSVISIIIGIGIAILAGYIPVIGELVVYMGSMCVLGGLIFIDRAIIKVIFQDRKESTLSLVRLPVYMLLGVVLVLFPNYFSVADMAVRICRSMGIALFILGLWRFFTFTTVEQQETGK